jgi:tight adherence protein B
VTDAQVILRFASLLEAGLSLSHAQRALTSQLELLQPAVRNQLSELIHLAGNHGGSVRELLEALADRLENETRLLEQIALAASSPRATARLVSLLPLVCLAFAQVLGINVFSTVTQNPAALISMLIGSLLLYANRRWLRRLLSRAELNAKTQVKGLQRLGAISLQLSAGVSAAAIRRQGSPPEVDEIFDLAQTHGAALLPLLRSQLRHLELRARYEVERSLASLAIRLLLPIGLLVLPALIFLAVIPAGLALLAAN